MPRRPLDRLCRPWPPGRSVLTMIHIKTAYGRPSSEHGPWMVGPFSVEMAPTAAVKRAGCFSKATTLGILVQLPDPDGVGSIELKHPAYMRQMADLAPRSASHLVIPHRVQFEVPGCPTVVGLGLYDPDGALEGYGVFRSVRVGWRRPEQFEFPSHRILIRRPTTPR